MALRANDPDALAPYSNHKRSPSNATYSDTYTHAESEKGEFHGGLHEISLAQNAKVDAHKAGKKGTLGASDKEAAEVEAEEQQFKLDVENESNESPAPFLVRPKKLASLVDPYVHIRCGLNSTISCLVVDCH